MGLSIYTNISGNTALSVIAKQHRNMSTVSQGLASGSALSGVRNNPAAISINTAFHSMISGSRQAIQNVNDGLSLAQTMDGAVMSVLDIYQRMRELGVQSLNGAYSDEQRLHMDAEFQLLYQEIGRIGETTKFNGIHLLNHDEGVNIHTGWGLDESENTKIPTIDLLAPLGETVGHL